MIKTTGILKIDNSGQLFDSPTIVVNPTNPFTLGETSFRVQWIMYNGVPQKVVKPALVKPTEPSTPLGEAPKDGATEAEVKVYVALREEWAKYSGKIRTYNEAQREYLQALTKTPPMLGNPEYFHVEKSALTFPQTDPQKSVVTAVSNYLIEQLKIINPNVIFEII